MNLTKTSSIRREDIGVVLKTLFKHEQSPLPPEAFADKYVKQDGKFKNSANDIVIELPGFPALRLKQNDRVLVGGGGIVFQCESKDLAGHKQALKITRPSLFREEKTAPLEFMASLREFITHAPISHQNVVRVLSGGNVDVRKAQSLHESYKCPAMLMEWLDSPTPLSKYLVQNCEDHYTVLNCLKQALSGLHCLHKRGLIHWDVKSDNILVDSGGTVRIVDLGNSRRAHREGVLPESEMGATDGGNTRIQSTRRNLPIPLRQLIAPSDSADSDRATLELPTPLWNHPRLDLWMFALELNRLLESSPSHGESHGRTKDISEAHVHVFNERCFSMQDMSARACHSHLGLIIRRMLYNDQCTEPAFYNSAAEVIEDIEKLDTEFGAAQSVPELAAIPQHVIRLPVSGNIPYTHRVGLLYNSIPLRRLSKHLQLATLVHVFPGAAHLRSEHVAGVLATVISYVRALFSDSADPFWRLNVDTIDVECLIVAALLHDVGHIAFGHFLEELKLVFDGCTHEDYVVELLDPSREGNFGVRTQAQIREDRQRIAAILESFWCVGCHPEAFMKRVGQIIRPTIIPEESLLTDASAVLDKAKADRIKLFLMHSILDGPLDADKMDYLSRDSHHCGVRYGSGIDTDRFLQALTAITCFNGNPDELEIRPARTPCIGVSEKGLLPAESLILARYQMFSAVYWQHTARAETAMLQFVILEFIGAGTSDSKCIQRLEAIMEEFRVRNDVESLSWLLEVVSHDSALADNVSVAIQGALTALLTRSGVFKTIYEREFRPNVDDSEYAGFLKLLEEGDDNPNSGLKNRVRKLKSVREMFAKELATQLHAFSNKRTVLSPLDVLLDTAPIGKDSGRDILIRTDRGVRDIDSISAITDAVTRTFSFWARKLRVFVSPECLTYLSSNGFSDEQLHSACHDAVRGLYRRLSIKAASIDVQKMRKRPSNHLR